LHYEITVHCNTVPYSLVISHETFGGTCCLFHSG